MRDLSLVWLPFRGLFYLLNGDCTVIAVRVLSRWNLGKALPVPYLVASPELTSTMALLLAAKTISEVVVPGGVLSFCSVRSSSLYLVLGRMVLLTHFPQKRHVVHLGKPHAQDQRGELLVIADPVGY